MKNLFLASLSNEDRATIARLNGGKFSLRRDLWQGFIRTTNQYNVLGELDISNTTFFGIIPELLYLIGLFTDSEWTMYRGWDNISPTADTTQAGQASKKSGKELTDMILTWYYSPERALNFQPNGCIKINTSFAQIRQTNI